jgi:ABC-type nitrate/sulfonate/bicarbonate transport system permease component
LVTSVAAQRPPGAGTRAATRQRHLVFSIAGSAAAIGILEVLPYVTGIKTDFLPPFHVMLRALVEQMGTGAFWGMLGSTLRGWAIGLTICLVGGIVIGILIGMVPALRKGTASTIEFLRPIPSVALIPLAVLMYGTTARSTLLLVIYAGFWQVLIQVLYGVQDVDPVARDTARSFQFDLWRQVRTVIWPTMLPYVLTGFRLAATVCLVLEVTGELIIGSPGIGKQILLAQLGGSNPIIYALVLLTGILGVAINLGAGRLQRSLLRWHPSIRREAER